MERSIIYHKCYIQHFRLLFFVALLSSTSCKKYITVETPDTYLGLEAAFKNNTSAAQVLTSIYGEMSYGLPNGSLVSTGVLPELSADNLTLLDPPASFNFQEYYFNTLEPTYTNTNRANTYWVRCYELIYRCNVAIEQLVGNKFLSEKTQRRLLGEAYFMRSFFYFYLVNFYSEVPLVLSSNYEQTRSLPKSSNAEVYNQIKADLATAEDLLDYTYTNPEGLFTTPNRLRPNLAAVNALRARVELYLKNYTAAEAAVTEVLSQPGYSLAPLNTVFLANSTETIWGLQTVTVGQNSELAILFLLPDSGPDAYMYPVYASQSLLNSFVPGDARRTSWFGNVTVGPTTYTYPAKYKRGVIDGSTSIEEYTIVQRVAELFLIRAEARNEQGNISGAVSDINALRDRSRAAVSADIPNPLPALGTSLTKEQLRPIILQERRAELFTEWGHRWFDLRRSGTIDAVMAKEQQLKGGTWEPFRTYYPIPQSDLDANPNLVQTPGYTN